MIEPLQPIDAVALRMIATKLLAYGYWPSAATLNTTASLIDKLLEVDRREREARAALTSPQENEPT